MKGLLLIGGSSSRMGADKSMLVFHHGLSQKEYAYSLLEKVCDEVYFSVREKEDISPRNIPDAFGNLGPLGAIASAQKTYPDTAWLVLACDLPMIKIQHLERLCKDRDASKMATCFMSPVNDLPEPLCAIWESSSEENISQFLKSGHTCPRQLLLNSDICLLPSPEPWALANANTPEDLTEIKARLESTSTKKKVRLCYYAELREITGKNEELFVTNSETVSGLFEDFRTQYKIQIKRKSMMVACNGTFCSWDTPVKEGDEIVFMPPFAGG